MFSQQNRKVQKKNWGMDSGGRQKNVQIVKPFLIGCRSKPMESSVPDVCANDPVDLSLSSGNSAPAGSVPQKQHTHRWCLYLRPFDNEDLGIWIKKVQFKLHESYPDHIRSVTQYPFEVEETGWGEFDVQVKVFFHDPHEREVTLYTWVRLLLKDNDPRRYSSGDGYNIWEYHDEFVFNEPTTMMSALLNTRKPEAFYKYPEIDYGKLEETTKEKIGVGRRRVLKEIEALKAQYEEYEAITLDLTAHLASLAKPSSLQEPDHANNAMDSAADQNMENFSTDL
ncbi:hypothetical protein RvY_17370 [Ramazzottius varieornatus]|uniref:YEATS domain-containing protein n=1 Tax=Ramazzottius varieornatus TaxID=947166 RepID=A0A1D1W2P5_RAMVA|nr:hypothetical protein RvY_17370 [Ramazzottius varieornatus]